MKKIFLRFLPIIILVLLSVWAGKGLFKYSVFSTHDGLHHISRSFDAIKTFSEGHFPLRWAGTLSYGCGVPIYNFFYPLIYYIVVLVNIIVPDVIQNLKIIDFATFFVGSIGFYFWIKQETKNKWVALSSAILYLYAPYRFSLVFVRGSPEFMAYAILPIVLYVYSLVFEAGSFKKFVVLSFLAALTGGLLAISHNFTVMFLMPIILLYLFIKLAQKWKVWRKSQSNNLANFGSLRARVVAVVFSFLSVFGFAAFFIFPAILEEKYTQIGTPSFTYSDHFPTLDQLINSDWDYFYSIIGPEDRMSFQLGYTHWVVLAVASMVIVYDLIAAFRTKSSPFERISKYIWMYLFFALSVIFVWLMLPESDFVWRLVPNLQRIQFPWRLLGICVFAISAMFPFLVIRIKPKKLFLFVLLAVSFLAFFGNRNHLLPMPVLDENLPFYTEDGKESSYWLSTTTFADDILPPSAKSACSQRATISTVEGINIPQKAAEKRSTSGSVNFMVEKSVLHGKKLLLLSTYFPGAYKLSLNGNEIPYFDCEGLVCIDANKVQAGPNNLTWQIVQTPIQSIFNTISLSFLIIWVLILVLFFTKKKFDKHHFVLILILIIFLFFRFYNLEKRIAFGWDQERDANAAIQILSGDIKLIGPRVLSDTGFFLPPYFFYILAPFYKLAGSSPYSMIPFLLFYNVVFFVLAYKIVGVVFNKKTALWFLAFWSVLPVAGSVDILAWNPVGIPLFFLIVIYLLHLAKKKARRFSFFLLGISWGLAVSMHVQALLIFPMILSVLVRHKKMILILFLGLFLVFSPILLFDLKNDFLNLRLVTNTFNLGQVRDPLAFLPVWDNFVARSFGLPVNRLISISFYLLIAVFLFLRSKETIVKGLLYVWLLFPVLFAIWGSRPSEYYFNFLLVIISLTFALIVQMSKKFMYAAFFAALLLLLAVKSTENTKDGVFGIYKKDKVVIFLSKITEESSPFHISFAIDPEGDSGFRYLLKWRGVRYSGKDSDPLIQITAPPSKSSTFIINAMGIEIPEGWIKENWVKN